MEFGKVKFFNSNPEKLYGFIRVLDEADIETGEELFFHFNDGEFITAGKKRPEFKGEATTVSRGRKLRLRMPQREDLLVFIRSQGWKGDKASPWGYKSNYDRALVEIENRPPPLIYRAYKSMNSLGRPEGEPELLYEGDLDGLIERYPLPTGRRAYSSDPLLPYWGDSDNQFEVRHWIEVYTGERWVRCEDPRKSV